MKSTRIRTWPSFRSLLTLLALAIPAVSVALESDMEQPIMIEADSLEINDREGTSLYRGNVVVDQGTIHITADSVKVTQRQDRADHILARGKPVFFRQQADEKGQMVEGTAETAEYDADSDTLYLTGNAILKQGKDSLKSDRIVYDRAKAVVRAGASAQGEKRVKVSIQPSKKKNNN